MKSKGGAVEMTKATRRQVTLKGGYLVERTVWSDGLISVQVWKIEAGEALGNC